MDTSRVSLGEMIAAAGGLVLLVCMFLPWFDGEFVGVPGRFPVETMTGWEAFGGVFDVLIVVLLAIPIGVAVGRAADALPPLPLEQGVIVLAAGTVLFTVTAFRLLDPPDVTDIPIPGLELETSRKPAVFVAVIAAGVIALGGYLQRSVRRVGFEPTSP